MVPADFISTIDFYGDKLIVLTGVFLLLSGVLLTLKTQFIQIRMLPKIVSLLTTSIFSKANSSNNTGGIPAHQALFTAMSTTIGIGNIVGPAMAIRMGGPGALLLFILALFVGSALTFSEVTCALNYRKKLSDGSYAGGPMQYIQAVLGKRFAQIYAWTGAFLLAAWSANQSNTLADICTRYSVPKSITGLIIALLVLFYLIGGIEKIGSFSAKIVPFMFISYFGSCLWIVLANIDKIPGIFDLMLSSIFSPPAIGGAAAGISIQQVLRWGIARGTHAGEGGVGTATIPQSQTTTDNPLEQGILSMASLYAVAFNCLLTGLVILLTGVWQDASIPVGINMIAQPFSEYIPASSLVLAVSVFLFALGTCLGNCYNGSQCFLYVTKKSQLKFYYILIGILIFFGSISDVVFIWSIVDYFVIPVALINTVSVLYLSFKRPNLFKI